MNILDKCNLTDDEADLLCVVINCFGEDSHHADESSIYFFTPNYAIECLEKAKKASADIVPLMLEAIYALTIKLEEHQKNWSAQ